MTDKLKIDIVSDVMCPWCIIGYKRLEKAILEMGIQDKIELEWQPFELNNYMPKEGEDIQEHVLRKYGTDAEGWKRSQEQMSKLGDEVDFEFDYYEGMRIVNTLDAHVLLDYAKENGKQTELNMCMVTAHFSERLNVSERDVLLHEAEKVGLDLNEAKARLVDESNRERVQNQIASWHSKGVNSVPTMIFNDESALVGAQPIYVYKRVLSELIEKE